MKGAAKKNNRYCFILCMAALAAMQCGSVSAQNITSPYSILGIGDVDTKDYSRYSASGSASLARRDQFSYNASNPASLTSLPYKLLNFDFAMRGRVSSFSDASGSLTDTASKDFILKRISMAFRVTPKTGIGFGLRPYSTVNYQFQNDFTISDGSTSYTKYTEGTGGINQVYFSTGTMLSKRLSAGATASWLFGSLKNTTQYYSSALALDLTKTDIDFYTGASFQGGLQYYTLPGKKWQHLFGLTGSVSTQLKGQLTTDYAEGDTTLKSTADNNRTYKLPVTIGFGYSAVKNESLTLSAEANLYKWGYSRLNYPGSYTGDAVRLSAGVEYAFRKKGYNVTYETGYLAMGATAERSYMRIQNNALWDYSFTIGGGRNIFRNISAYGNLEFGRKGSISAGQIRESYTQFVLGFAVKDIWIGAKRTGRYN